MQRREEGSVPNAISAPRPAKSSAQRAAKNQEIAFGRSPSHARIRRAEPKKVDAIYNAFLDCRVEGGRVHRRDVARKV